MSRPPKKVYIQDWQKLGEERIVFFLEAIRKTSLRKKLPLRVPLHVELYLVSKKKISQLNLSFRKKSRPTDILSFSTTEPFHRIGQLGELVICVTVLKEQAKAFCHDPEVELDILIVHGLLHLLGFDHELGEMESAQMALWEKKLLLREGSLIGRAKLAKVSKWKK